MNLVQRAINAGGKLVPIVIKEGLVRGTGLTNPAIFIDDDGDILVNLRHINYSLYHAEKDMKFPSPWGPLAYLHPEKDMNLRTYNYLCRLDKNLNMTDYCLIDTSTLDVPPLWEFVGLEDGRLVKWESKYYLAGVRRDTTENGQGRMELSEIAIDKDKWTAKEISRLRIPAPGTDESYCEKNWYPILDKPYHFVKWTAPTEIVRTYPELPARCEQVSLTNTFDVPADQRGGTQLVRWDNYYLSITHEVGLWNNYLGQKNGLYRHRLCVFDENYNLIGLSPEKFSFLDACVEFCSGAAVLDNNLLLTFGFSDNAAFVLKITDKLIKEMIQEAISYGNN